mmetsp:Transcript_3603/g.9318  ORF Transcript_3603/g.9318 Transcript_3603/m.9318 type:complete len:90 (+) Transcript_3603:2-271(+)
MDGAPLPSGEDESQKVHEWTQKVLGANGEKASPAMRKVLKESGAGALAELLKKQYAAEHQANEAAQPPKRPLEAEAEAELDPSKRVRPV